MKALSIRQPWTAMIVHGTKRIENRSRPTLHRGLLALHASGPDRWDKAGQDSEIVATQWSALEWPGTPDRRSPHIVYGAVLGVAEVVGACPSPIDEHGHLTCNCGPWAAFGQWHWELTNVRRLTEPVSCKGALGLWTLPDEVEAAVVAQLGEQVNTRG